MNQGTAGVVNLDQFVRGVPNAAIHVDIYFHPDGMWQVVSVSQVMLQRLKSTLWLSLKGRFDMATSAPSLQLRGGEGKEGGTHTTCDLNLLVPRLLEY